MISAVSSRHGSYSVFERSAAIQSTNRLASLPACLLACLHACFSEKIDFFSVESCSPFRSVDDSEYRKVPGFNKVPILVRGSCLDVRLTHYQSAIGAAKDGRGCPTFLHNIHFLTLPTARLHPALPHVDSQTSNEICHSVQRSELFRTARR